MLRVIGRISTLLTLVTVAACEAIFEEHLSALISEDGYTTGQSQCHLQLLQSGAYSARKAEEKSLSTLWKSIVKVSGTETRKHNKHCDDRPDADVAAFGRAQSYGDGITCKKAQEENLCDSFFYLCNHTCQVCEREAAKLLQDAFNATWKDRNISRIEEAIDIAEEDGVSPDDPVIIMAKKKLKVFQERQSAQDLRVAVKDGYQEHNLTKIKAAIDDAESKGVEPNDTAIVWAEGRLETFGNLTEFSSGFAIGDSVAWATNSTVAIPKGSVGFVTGFTPTKVKAKFMAGEFDWLPDELEKTDCLDSPKAEVAKWAASQYFGDGMTCAKAKKEKMCDDLLQYCALTCGWCDQGKDLATAAVMERKRQPSSEEKAEFLREEKAEKNRIKKISKKMKKLAFEEHVS